MSEFIPVNEPILDGNEKSYLLECIETGWISSEGPFVNEFEKKFAATVERTYAVSVANGTGAIDIAIAALDIQPGDEVILPTFTIISCIQQIIRCGATPVLMDADPDTWNIKPEELEALITDKTKAIMVVHIYGLPVDMAPVLEIAGKYGIKIIEDAAEMHGQTYRGRPCGSFGDISTFSFYPNKHITTGEGGMIVTNDYHIAETCRSLRNLCFQPKQRFIHERLGWNLRLTNLQAAVGLAQLERLDEFVEKKRKIGRTYNEMLSDIPGIQLPLQKTDFAENIYWVYGLTLDPNIHGDATFVMERLNKVGIGTRPFFFPMHMQPVLLQMGYFKGQTYPNAEYLSRQGFYIPSGLALTPHQIDQVSCSLHEILC